MNKYLICEHAELLKNLPKVISDEKSKISVISRKKSALTNNKFVNEYIEIGQNPNKDFSDQFIADKKLISKLNGWIIWGNDEIMRKVATSTLSLDEKLRILPIRKKIGLQILGSKVGLAKVSKKIELNTPKTLIAKNNIELTKVMSDFTGPLIVKADRFGGGEFVKQISSEKEKKELNIPKDWFPVVVQDYVSGELVSVEGFFKDGKLVAWMYSSKTRTLGEFGASYARTYKSPTLRDFEHDLINLAKECGLHGMFNCTFILKSGMHFLIEADARPNVWHFLYAHFKIPVLEIMTEKLQTPITPLDALPKNKHVKVIDLDRSIPYAFKEKKYKLLLSSIFEINHSTQWLAGKKFKTIKIFALALLLLLVTWLPQGLLTRMKNFGLIKNLHRRVFER